MLILWCTLKDPVGKDAGHIAGRRLLARGLELLGCPGGEKHVRYAAGGKPYIPDGPEFSVSHSENAALCALDARPLGADVEEISAVPEELLPALTPEERSYVLLASGAERERRFYRIWTVKESLVKASGDGLGAIREQESAVTPELAIKRRVSGFYVHVLDLPGEGRAAAVSAVSPETPELVRVSVEGV